MQAGGCAGVAKERWEKNPDRQLGNTQCGQQTLHPSNSWRQPSLGNHVPPPFGPSAALSPAHHQGEGHQASPFKERCLSEKFVDGFLNRHIHLSLKLCISLSYSEICDGHHIKPTLLLCSGSRDPVHSGPFRWWFCTCPMCPHPLDCLLTSECLVTA